MTPEDFLNSVVVLRRHRDQPKEPVELHPKTMEIFVSNVPNIRSWDNEKSALFRHLGPKGVITYIEYLFLLAMLEAPTVQKLELGFRMMQDRTREKKTLSKKEFMAFCDKLAKYENDGPFPTMTTTLMAHFFGGSFLSWSHELTLESFLKFVRGLQREVLKIEFNTFGKGGDVIEDVHFATILLKFIQFPGYEFEHHINRMHKALDGEERMVTFDEFMAFSEILNNIEDFGTYLNLYVANGQDITKELFRTAAARVHPQGLSKNVVDILFGIFDFDEDGLLSPEEFGFVMRCRGRRKLRPFSVEGWLGFKSCFREKLRAQNKGFSTF